MGSKETQGRLWSQQPEDWATIQELAGSADGYAYALEHLNLIAGDKLLDVGCGSGVFSALASSKGIKVDGLDASEALLHVAGKRNTSATFVVGEMEELPFADHSFDAVCGFNSFQYAASTQNALAEAFRVLKPGGKIVVLVWGNKEDCEAATFLKAVGGLLPPPPPGAPGPFALSENQMLENLLTEVGFKIVESTDVNADWHYENKEITLRGLMSTGPVARAVENSGFDKTYDTIAEAIKPYTKSNGNVDYSNKFRIVLAEK